MDAHTYFGFQATGCVLVWWHVEAKQSKRVENLETQLKFQAGEDQIRPTLDEAEIMYLQRRAILNGQHNGTMQRRYIRTTRVGVRHCAVGVEGSRN